MLNTNSNNNDKPSASSHPDDFLKAMETKKKEAVQFLISRGYETCTNKGQRISINRNLFISPQEEEDIKQTPWNEVFVGHLPRDLFEDELLPIMERAGQIYRIRYMMDFSQSNRGYAFFQYVHRQDAIRAWAFLDDHTVREGYSRIGVKLSFDNKRLFFGNLPDDCTSDQLVAALKNHGLRGIESADMADEDMVSRHSRGHQHFSRKPTPNGFNRHSFYNNHNSKTDRSGRYCYVHFETHEDATQARRMLLPCEAKLFNRRLTCDWAKSAIPEDIQRHHLQEHNHQQQNHRKQPQPWPRQAE